MRSGSQWERERPLALAERTAYLATRSSNLEVAGVGIDDGKKRFELTLEPKISGEIRFHEVIPLEGALAVVAATSDSVAVAVLEPA